MPLELESEPLNFEMTVGTTRVLNIHCRTKNEDGTYTPIDVTGWSFYYEIRSSYEAPTYYIRKVVATDQIVLLNPSQGLITIKISGPTDFSTPPKYNSPYFNQCIGVSPGGEPYSVGDGNVVFTRKVVAIS